MTSGSDSSDGAAGDRAAGRRAPSSAGRRASPPGRRALAVATPGALVSAAAHAAAIGVVAAGLPWLAAPGAGPGGVMQVELVEVAAVAPTERARGRTDAPVVPEADAASDAAAAAPPPVAPPPPAAPAAPAGPAILSAPVVDAAGVAPPPVAAPPPPQASAGPAPAAVARSTAPRPRARPPVPADARPRQVAAAPAPAETAAVAARPPAPGGAGAGARTRAAAPGGGGGAPAAHEARLGAEVRRAVARAQVYPPKLRARGVEGVATVAIRVGRDGRLIDARLIDGSGHAALDAASLAAARATTRFTPAPAGADREVYAFTLRVVFDIAAP